MIEKINSVSESPENSDLKAEIGWLKMEILTNQDVYDKLAKEILEIIEVSFSDYKEYKNSIIQLFIPINLTTWKNINELFTYLHNFEWLCIENWIENKNEIFLLFVLNIWKVLNSDLDSLYKLLESVNTIREIAIDTEVDSIIPFFNNWGSDESMFLSILSANVAFSWKMTEKEIVDRATNIYNTLLHNNSWSWSLSAYFSARYATDEIIDINVLSDVVTELKEWADDFKYWDWWTADSKLFLTVFSWDVSKWIVSSHNLLENSDKLYWMLKKLDYSHEDAMSILLQFVWIIIENWINVEDFVNEYSIAYDDFKQKWYSWSELIAITNTFLWYKYLLWSGDISLWEIVERIKEGIGNNDAIMNWIIWAAIILNVNKISNPSMIRPTIR